MPKENQMVRCPVCQCLIPQRAYEAHIAPVSDELVSSGIKPVDEVLGEQHEQWCKDNHIEPASQPDTGHPYDQSDLDDS